MDYIKQLKELYNLTTQNLYRMNKYFIKHKMQAASGSLL